MRRVFLCEHMVEWSDAEIFALSIDGNAVNKHNLIDKWLTKIGESFKMQFSLDDNLDAISFSEVWLILIFKPMTDDGLVNDVSLIILIQIEWNSDEAIIEGNIKWFTTLPKYKCEFLKMMKCRLKW